KPFVERGGNRSVQEVAKHQREMIFQNCLAQLEKCKKESVG
ncbi:unnamed protein product, partial [marine sediment metagenome]